MLPFGLILLSSDPLPSLDHAYQPIVQDERVRFARGIDEEKPTNVLGFVVHATTLQPWALEPSHLFSLP